MVFVLHRRKPGSLRKSDVYLTKTPFFSPVSRTRQSLTIHMNARKKFNTGDILNFASVDILQLFQFTQVCGHMIGIPTRMMIGFCITYNLIGPAVIGMVCALLLLMPLSIYLVISLDKINVSLPWRVYVALGGKLVGKPYLEATKLFLAILIESLT